MSYVSRQDGVKKLLFLAPGGEQTTVMGKSMPLHKIADFAILTYKETNFGGEDVKRFGSLPRVGKLAPVVDVSLMMKVVSVI